MVANGPEMIIGMMRNKESAWCVGAYDSALSTLVYVVLESWIDRNVAVDDDDIDIRQSRTESHSCNFFFRVR